jgi:hypothetical protein
LANCNCKSKLKITAELPGLSTALPEKREILLGKVITQQANWWSATAKSELKNNEYYYAKITRNER